MVIIILLWRTCNYLAFVYSGEIKRFQKNYFFLSHPSDTQRPTSTRRATSTSCLIRVLYRLEEPLHCVLLDDNDRTVSPRVSRHFNITMAEAAYSLLCTKSNLCFSQTWSKTLLWKRTEDFDFDVLYLETGLFNAIRLIRNIYSNYPNSILPYY